MKRIIRALDSVTFIFIFTLSMAGASLTVLALIQWVQK